LDEEYREVLQNAKDSIAAKRAKGSALKGVMSRTFSKDAAKTFLAANGKDPSTVNVNTEME